MYAIYSMEAVSGYYNFIANLQFKLRALKRLKQVQKTDNQKKTEQSLLNEKAFA